MIQPSETSLPGAPQVSMAELGALTLASLDHLHEAISIVDKDLRLRVWNRQFVELLDFPPELIHAGMPLADIITYNAQRGEYGPGDPIAQVEERMGLAWLFKSHCFERARPNGTVLQVRGEPIPGGGFITVYEDITTRKQAQAALRENYEQLEERVHQRTAELLDLNGQLTREIEERKRIDTALRESETRVRLITDTVPVLIGYLDSQQRYQFVNQKYAEWFGLPVSAFLGRHFGDLLEPALARRLQPHVTAALNGQSTHVEYDLTTLVKRLYVRSYFIAHVSPDSETARQQMIGCFVLSEDLTEHRYVQMALNQAQKLKAVGQLTGGIAHDFNNLLTVMMGNLTLLEESVRTQPESHKAARTALNAARRGADLTRRLLAFSRQQTLQPRVLSPRQQLPEIAELLARTLDAGIELETVAKKTVWNVRVDPGQLTNAILNLAINARDAMPNGGRLRIEARNVTLSPVYVARYPDLLPGDYVRIAVSDTGSGMAPEVIERAFEPFFTTKGFGAGTGLGLSMVYGFVKQSGGHVRIRSRVGHGTTVELYLSRYLPKERDLGNSPTDTVLDESRLRGQETVLLVEDDPDIREFAVRTLTEFGYTVHEAANGREALAVLATAKPLDLLLSDLSMPGGTNGRDLAIEARRHHPALKVLYISGYSDHAVAGLLPLEYPLLEKPFLKLDLARAVRATLDQPEKVGTGSAPPVK